MTSILKALMNIKNQIINEKKSTKIESISIGYNIIKSEDSLFSNESKFEDVFSSFIAILHEINDSGFNININYINDSKNVIDEIKKVLKKIFKNVTIYEVDSRSLMNNLYTATLILYYRYYTKYACDRIEGKNVCLFLGILKNVIRNINWEKVSELCEFEKEGFYILKGYIESFDSKIEIYPSNLPSFKLLESAFDLLLDNFKILDFKKLNIDVLNVFKIMSKVYSALKNNDQLCIIKTKSENQKENENEELNNLILKEIDSLEKNNKEKEKEKEKDFIISSLKNEVSRMYDVNALQLIKSEEKYMEIYEKYNNLKEITAHHFITSKAPEYNNAEFLSNKRNQIKNYKEELELFVRLGRFKNFN